MSNQGQKVKKSIFDFKQRLEYWSLIFVKRVTLIRLKGIIGNHEINWIVSLQ